MGETDRPVASSTDATARTFSGRSAEVPPSAVNWPGTAAHAIIQNADGVHRSDLSASRPSQHGPDIASIVRAASADACVVDVGTGMPRLVVGARENAKIMAQASSAANKGF